MSGFNFNITKKGSNAGTQNNNQPPVDEQPQQHSAYTQVSNSVQQDMQSMQQSMQPTPQHMQQPMQPAPQMQQSMQQTPQQAMPATPLQQEMEQLQSVPPAPQQQALQQNFNQPQDFSEQQMYPDNNMQDFNQPMQDPYGMNAQMGQPMEQQYQQNMNNEHLGDTMAIPPVTQNNMNDNMEEQEEEPEKKKMSKGKLIGLIAGLGLIILLVLGAGGYFAYQTFFGNSKDYAEAVATATKSVQNELKTLSSTNVSDVNSAKNVITQASDSIDKLYTNLSSLTPPDGYKDFHEQYLGLLERLNKDYKELKDILSKDNLTSSDASKINDVISDLNSLSSEYTKLLSEHSELVN